MERFGKFQNGHDQAMSSISYSLSLDGSNQLKRSAEGLRLASRSTMHVDTNVVAVCCHKMLSVGCSD